MSSTDQFTLSNRNTSPPDLLDRLSIRRLDRSELKVLYPLNSRIFNEERLINSLDHHLMISLVAELNGIPVGFKVGYKVNSRLFYSAKGGVDPGYRKMGIARALLYRMLLEAARDNFELFYYDTFPNLYPGMYHLGLREGFHIEFIQWNHRYKDYQVRLQKSITPAGG